MKTIKFLKSFGCAFVTTFLIAFACHAVTPANKPERPRETHSVTQENLQSQGGACPSGYTWQSCVWQVTASNTMGCMACINQSMYKPSSGDWSHNYCPSTWCNPNDQNCLNCALPACSDPSNYSYQTCHDGVDCAACVQNGVNWNATSPNVCSQQYCQGELCQVCGTVPPSSEASLKKKE